METIKISKKEYDRLCNFEKNVELNRVTTIDKLMTAKGHVEILQRKVSGLEMEIKSQEFKSIQNDEYIKCLQDEINLLKKTSIVRFVYWRWLNNIKQL